MLTKAIVRPPASNFAEGLTTAALGAPDYQLALQQYSAYCKALEQCGLTLIRLDADSDHPDSCFVEDTAVLINAFPDAAAPHANNGAPTHAVLTRPGAASRIGEVDGMRVVLKQTLSESAIDEIQPPGTLDGGDVCEAGGHFFIGVSARTNEAGAKQLADFVVANGYTSSVIDICGLDSLLHLKSALAYVGNNRLVVTEALAGGKDFADFEIIQVPAGEEYAANCLSINDWVLVAEGFPQFDQRLRNLGYRVLALDMSEFQKMDGGLSCLSLRW